MKTTSILRDCEYEEMAKLKLAGSILDVGGSKKSGYHELVAGDHTFHVINLDPTCEPDTFVDIENAFPFADGEFDGAICLNVLEHIFEVQNAFAETVRVVKVGGTLVFATPFMHHIHGSPDDYGRYTESHYRKMAAKYGCEVASITPLGAGFFSLGYQSVGGSLPTNLLRQATKRLALTLDGIGNRFSSRYRTLSARIPLGYFVVMTKVVNF
jgi:SAM-dependent methyltransferase